MRAGIYGRMETEPNVVPMIDVLLVLIIIFMLMMGRVHMTMQLPADTASAGQQNETLVLEVMSDGSYRINGSTVMSGALVDTLTAMYRERPRTLLFIRGDRDRAYKDIIAAMDAAKEAGVEVFGWMPNR